MKLVLVAFLLLLPSCRSILEPAPQSLASKLGDDPDFYDYPRNGARISNASARMTSDAVIIEATVTPPTYLKDWVATVLVDVDQNTATGRFASPPPFGAELEARLIEAGLPDNPYASSGPYPVRKANDASYPFGSIAGWGKFEAAEGHLMVRIPLEALNDSDGCNVRLIVFRGGSVSPSTSWDAAVLPGK